MILLAIYLHLIELYTIIGLVVYALSFDTLLFESFKEGGSINIKGKLILIFLWPFHIEYLIWPGNCWREYEDENGKVHHVRISKRGLLKAKKYATKHKEEIITEKGFEEYNRIISNIDKELEEFKN